MLRCVVRRNGDRGLGSATKKFTAIDLTADLRRVLCVPEGASVCVHASNRLKLGMWLDRRDCFGGRDFFILLRKLR